MLSGLPAFTDPGAVFGAPCPRPPARRGGGLWGGRHPRARQDALGRGCAQVDAAFLARRAVEGRQAADGRGVPFEALLAVLGPRHEVRIARAVVAARPAVHDAAPVLQPGQEEPAGLADDPVAVDVIAGHGAWRVAAVLADDADAGRVPG